MTSRFKNQESHQLLWTGGWDSTFQLLSLLLKKKEKVTPIYLLDPNRKSITIEIKTMALIRQGLIEAYPECRENFLPTLYYAVTDIPPDEEISNAYKRITRTHHLGTQYEWLARYCKYQGIKKLQLGIEIGGSAESLIGHMIQTADNDNPFPYIKPSDSSDPIYAIFRYFTFPIIHLTKHEMKAIADESNWQQWMEMTWFCLTPTRHNTPCGICNPCRLAINEGFGWRIPLLSRVYGAMYHHTIEPIRSRAKKTLLMAGLMKQKT